MQKQKPKYSYFSGSGNFYQPAGKLEKIWKLINKVNLVMIIILGITFVTSINSLSIKGYVLSELKKKIKVLNAEGENMGLKIAALQSYENISQKAKKLKMVKADKVEYVIVSGKEVAKK